jgi:hypothetical protein
MRFMELHSSKSEKKNASRKDEEFEKVSGPSLCGILE